MYWLRVEQDTAWLQVKRYHGQIVRVSEKLYSLLTSALIEVAD